VPGCQMPFKSKKTAFDSKCGMNGSSDDADKIAESRAKNNFCANAKDLVRVSSDDFLALQKASDDLSTRKFVDRSPLHQLTTIGGAKVGEGTVVEFVAYVLEAHYSDVASGETVNCRIPGKSNNDIRIVLVQDPSDDPCTSITAEISPHYRPAGWTDETLNSAGKHPVRVRGPLFFDGAH